MSVKPGKIGISTYGADGGRSGIGSYLREILQVWESQGLTQRVELILDPSEVDYYRKIAPGASLLVQPAGLTRNVPGTLWHWFCLPWICWRRGYRSLFLVAANRRTTWWCPSRTVGTVHDLAALRVSGKYSKLHDFYLRRILPRQLHSLNQVLTVSHASARDIEHFAGIAAAAIQVIPLAADPSRFFPESGPGPGHRLQRQLPERYLFYLARLEHPGKGHVPLIRAFDQYLEENPGDVHLVLAGSPWDRHQEIEQAAQSARHRERIHFLGFVDQNEVPDLYRRAEAVVFPSFYEGFGLPVLEAMACGVPLACSNRGSLPEVAGEASVQFDPAKVEELVSALRQILTPGPQREALVQAGLAQAARFSWERTARATWQALIGSLEE